MSPQNPEWMLFLYSWLVTYAIHGVVWFALAWILARYLRAAKLRELIWKASVVGALVSASFYGFVAEYFARPAWSVEQMPSAMNRSASVFGMSSPSAATRSLSSMNIDSIISMPAVLEPLSPWLDQVSFELWVLSLWALGATIGVVHLFRARRRCLDQLEKSGDEPDGKTLRLLNDLVAKSKSNRVPRLRFSRDLSSPVALAGGTLYLPTRVAEELSETEQQAVLAHELAHTIRRDPEWQLVLAVLSRLFCFQPLLRMTARRLETEAELLCDDHAAVWSGSGVALARGLQQVAIWTCDKARVPAWTGTPMVQPVESNRSALVQRVERLLSDQVESPSRRSKLTLSALFCAFAIAMACTGPGIDIHDPRNRTAVAQVGGELPVIRASAPKPNENPAITIDFSDVESNKHHYALVVSGNGMMSAKFARATQFHGHGSETEVRLPVDEGMIVNADERLSGSLEMVFDIVDFVPSADELRVGLEISANAKANSWLSALEFLASRGQSQIAIELPNSGRIRTPLVPRLATTKSNEVLPTLEISISVIEAGRKVHSQTGKAWEREGAFVYKDRRVSYASTSPSTQMIPDGFAYSAGMASDTLEELATYLASKATEQPGLGAILIPEEGTIFADVSVVLSILKQIGIERIEFASQQGN